MTTQNLKNEIMKLNREELNEIINAVQSATYSIRYEK